MSLADTIVTFLGACVIGSMVYLLWSGRLPFPTPHLRWTKQVKTYREFLVLVAACKQVEITAQDLIDKPSRWTNSKSWTLGVQGTFHYCGQYTARTRWRKFVLKEQYSIHEGTEKGRLDQDARWIAHLVSQYSVYHRVLQLRHDLPNATVRHLHQGKPAREDQITMLRRNASDNHIVVNLPD